MYEIPGFASAQRAYENMEPANTDCGCPTLYSCPTCGEYYTEAGVCPVADCKVGNDLEGYTLTPLERDESTEGFETDPKCDLHNHFCSERWCCDDPDDYDD